MGKVTDSFFTNDQGFIAINRKLDELTKHEAQAKFFFFLNNFCNKFSFKRK